MDIKTEFITWYFFLVKISDHTATFWYFQPLVTEWKRNYLIWKQSQALLLQFVVCFTFVWPQVKVSEWGRQMRMACKSISHLIELTTKIFLVKQWNSNHKVPVLFATTGTNRLHQIDGKVAACSAFRDDTQSDDTQKKTISWK